MAVKCFEDEIMSSAREVSEDWATCFSVPMDCDEVEECADIFRRWLDFFQGNLTKEELSTKQY